MWGNIKMIKNTAMEFTLGLMVVATKVIGTKENNMELVHTLYPKKTSSSTVCGKMVRE